MTNTNLLQTRSDAAYDTANPIHLHRAGRSTVCAKDAQASRTTRYPALVTCRQCIAGFTQDDTRTASQQATEPYDC